MTSAAPAGTKKVSLAFFFFFFFHENLMHGSDLAERGIAGCGGKGIE